MTLYSYKGQTPAPLPFRITLPNGFTRTDPLTFTKEEIEEAGFSGPYIPPIYDPEVESLEWVDNEYVISPLPPPEPDWEQFKGLLAEGVSRSLQTAQAEDIVSLMPAIGSIIPETTVIGLAQECNLPEDFVQGILG